MTDTVPSVDSVAPQRWETKWITRFGPNVTNTLWYAFIINVFPNVLFGQYHHAPPLPISLVFSFIFPALFGRTAQMISAVTCSCFSGRSSRERGIRAGVVTGVVAIVPMVAAMVTYVSWLQSLAFVAWGVYVGLTNTNVEALLADSVPQGRRVRVYTVKYMIEILSSVLSVAIMIVFIFLNLVVPGLLRYGMSDFYYVAVCLHAIGFFYLWQLKDTNVVLAEEEAVTDAQPSIDATDPHRIVPESARELSVSNAALTDSNEVTKESSEEPRGWAEGVAFDVLQGSSLRRWVIAMTHLSPHPLASAAAVPYWMCASDFMLAASESLLVSVLPYYCNSFDMGFLQYLFFHVAMPIVLAATSFLLLLWVSSAEQLRVPMVLLVRLAGALALVVLCVNVRLAGESNGMATYVLFGMYYALMHSVAGVTRSVIMDSVAQNKRMCWAAFESVVDCAKIVMYLFAYYILAEDLAYSNVSVFVLIVVHLVGVATMIPAALGVGELEARLADLRARDEAPTAAIVLVSE